MIAGILIGPEFPYLLPICLAIALVTSAAHRERMRDILRHAAGSWTLLVVGIVLFRVAFHVLMEGLLPHP